MSTHFKKIIPILRIFDISKAREFYLDWLGFTVDWEHRFEADLPLYMQISRGNLTLHLTEHHGDCSPGGKVFVEVEGIEEFHKELSDKNYNYNRPGLGPAPWNAICLEVTDPFGNRICFSQPNA